MPRGTVSPASGRLRIPAGSLWLSGALLLVTDVAAGLTAFGGFLRGPPEMMGSARGTAIVQLVVTGPVLVVAMAMGARGSARAVVVWLGALAALLYNAQMLLYGTPFNSLFLLYVAMPLAMVAGVWLWRRGTAGYLISAALLTMWVIEGISIAVDQWFGYRADHASVVASLSVVPAFAVLAVVGLLPLIVHLRHVTPQGRSE